MFEIKRYIICSKKDAKSGDGGWQSLTSYFELGWEVANTHLDAKHLFASGQFLEGDVIVTLKGREFLYSKLMPVMTWEDFAEAHGITDGASIPVPNIVDLTHDYAATSGFNGHVYHGGPNGTYLYAVTDKEAILTFDTPDVSHLTNVPYAVCCWRVRKEHMNFRDTPEAVAKEINAELLKKFERVYVVGLNVEEWCDGEKVVHVTFPEYAALISSPKCGVVVGAQTGTMQLAGIACPTKVLVYQHNAREYVNGANYPCVMGDCVNIAGNRREIYYAPETPLNIFLGHLNNFIQ